MKTAIVINIGLTDKNNNPVELHNAIRATGLAGVSILSSSVVTGEWEGVPEQTLVVGGLALASDELTRRLHTASAQLSQHCIAVWHDGRGELIGDNPEGWKFDTDLFHFHTRELPHQGRVKTPTDLEREKLEPLSIAELKRRVEFLEQQVAYFENLATERKEQLEALEK